MTENYLWFGADVNLTDLFYVLRKQVNMLLCQKVLCL